MGRGKKPLSRELQSKIIEQFVCDGRQLRDIASSLELSVFVVVKYISLYLGLKDRPAKNIKYLTPWTT